MFFNQQVTQQRVFKLDAPRLVALMAFIAAALVLVGCKSAPDEQVSAPAPQPVANTTSGAAADDLTATEAAIAAMNEMAQAEPAPAQTAQLIRPDAPMNY